MGNIFKVLRRDFLRLFKVPAAWVILFGMVFIPPLYSWYNIVGFWDPYGNTKGITVAIGTDNICDYMVPLCEGDMWQELSLLAAGCRFPDLDAMVNIASVNGRKVLGLD